MDTPSIDWTENEAGCYAVASLGEKHVFGTLADLIEDYNKKLSDLLHSRLDTIYADLTPSVAEAMDILNEHTAEGMAWILNEEGLFLMKGEDL